MSFFSLIFYEWKKEELFDISSKYNLSKMRKKKIKEER